MDIINDLTTKELAFGLGAFLSTSVGTLFAHEYSHLTAIRTLFTNNPYLECDFLRFYCFAAWNGPPIMRPELSITYETARGIVSAAGPASDITMVALASMGAWKMRQSNKKISTLFAGYAFTNAVSGIFANAIESQIFGISSNGDYAKVELFLGIPCFIQTTIAGALVLGTTLLMRHILFSNPIEKKAVID